MVRACVLGHDLYSEDLNLTPLPRNGLLANFNFQVKSLPQSLQFHEDNKILVDAASVSHYSYFPRSIGPILETTNTRELHLRFTQGWWDSDLWGSLPFNGTKSGGTGVELWAVIEAPNTKEALKSWSKLSVLLSAFFCATLNAIDDSITTFPINSFKDKSDSYMAQDSNKLFLVRAALPAEPICTENLTPFLKLLPTRGKAGISSLLDGHKVFDSLWHSMSIDITTECDLPDSNQCSLVMDQSISTIIDVMRSLRKIEEGAIPKPVSGDDLRCDKSKGYTVWQCFPLGLPTELKYDLMTLFGRAIKGAPFANEKTPITVNFKDDPWKVLVKEGINKIVSLTEFQPTYAIGGTEDINIEFDSSNSTVVKDKQEPPLLVSRSLTGYSQDLGGFRVVFDNPGDDPVKFVYFESLPWFTRLYLNTMEATSKAGDGTYKKVDLNQYVNLSHYQPALDRKRPSHMELSINLPAKETLTLHYKFDKSLLLYAEYPPDANHGFSVDPAVVTVFNDENEKVYELRTTSSLVTLPTPDFSMPYNVIILTGTVMSLAFGSIFNLLTKETITEEELEKTAKKSKLKLLIERLKSKIAAVKGLFKK